MASHARRLFAIAALGAAAGLVDYGTFLVYRPAGFIVAGLLIGVFLLADVGL